LVIPSAPKAGGIFFNFETMSSYLLVGLGNPGMEYANTRHNIGFDVIDHFVASHGGRFETSRLADVAKLRIKGRTVVCIKPSTFMNLSGRAVKYWMDKEKVDISGLLVILDELSIPLSKLRLKMQGSDGGHNGLKHIEEVLSSRAYARLRFGIGNDYPKGGQVDFVLGKWTAAEMPVVRQKVEKCAEVIERYIFAGPERTMTEVNNLEFPL
jgi:peptidyl-tRNA hydrolase, PTH1 family